MSSSYQIPSWSNPHAPTPPPASAPPSAPPASTSAWGTSNSSNTSAPYAGQHQHNFAMPTLSSSVVVPTTNIPPAVKTISPVSSTGAPVPVPDSYFTETRKGEVNELRELLRNFGTEKDPIRKRDIIKKVIAYMTIGIDVSRLFTEMMLVIETRDLVIKKMIYMYLCNYATSHPDLAKMCINTLQKDCGNDDPMVRGLALRSLSSLRLPEMVEYIAEPLRRALTDSHAYVRKTAVMGSLKLHHLDPSTFEKSNFVNILYDMIRDHDAAVVTNCIIVLNEVMSSGPHGGMALNRAIILHLLNRLREFSEFGIVIILDLVSRYIPADEEEGYQIMNLLDPILRTSNTSAFMAVIKVFLSMSDSLVISGNNAATGPSLQALRFQIVSRIKAPLITMMSGGSHELMYTLLKHIDSLIELCPGVFNDEYRQFYIRYNEPTHVKYLKISILSKVVTPYNAPDIVAELAECVASVDPMLSRLSVRSLTRIACRDEGGEGCTDSITRRLVEMLDLDISHVNAEAASALADIVRQHPMLRAAVAPTLPRAVKFVMEAKGKANLLYLLGECGDIVREAPYCVEKLIDSYDSIRSPEIKIALLTNSMKLFFKRPPEMQRMLGRLLAKATVDVSSQDVHDRAILYYRLLRTNIDPASKGHIVSTHIIIAGAHRFAEDGIDDDLREDLIKEFNTLSTIYGTTHENFIAEKYHVPFVKMPSEHPLTANSTATDPQLEQLSAPSIYSTPSSLQVTDHDHKNFVDIATVSTLTSDMDLLGFGDDIGASESSRSSLILDASYAMTSDDYQSQWGSISDTQAFHSTVSLRTQPTSTEMVENLLQQASIKPMASGELPSELKFFLYAKDSRRNSVILIQLSISKGTPQITASFTLKLNTDDSHDYYHRIMDHMRHALALLL